MENARPNSLFGVFIILNSVFGFAVFFLAPLVGLIWMAVEGLWWGILWGFGFGFLGILGLGLSQIPIALIALPAAKVYDAGHKKMAVLLVLPSSILMSGAFQTYFFLIVNTFLEKYQGQASGFALFLYSFGVATGGLGYMLSKDTRAGGGSSGAFQIVFATVGFLAAIATQYYNLLTPLASVGLATLIGFVGTAFVGISKMELQANGTE